MVAPAASLRFVRRISPKFRCSSAKRQHQIINDRPLPGGFVKELFSAVLQGGVTTDGILDNTTYNMSGSFSILRQ